MSEEQEQSKQGCLGTFILAVIIVFAWPFIFGGSDDSGDTSSSEQMIPMRGTIIVYDQETCADGPMVKISAGARGPIPVEFQRANAPCSLNFEIEVPSQSTTYKIQVNSLPSQILTPDEMRKTSAGGEYFEVRLVAP